MGVLGERKKEKKKLLTRLSSLEMTHYAKFPLLDMDAPMAAECGYPKKHWR